MTRSILVLTVLMLLVGCGGGGGGGPAGETRPLVKLTPDNTVTGLSDTYRAVFTCSASITVNGIAVNATGTYTLWTGTGTVAHPQTTLEGKPLHHRFQLSAMGQNIDVTLTSYIYVDPAGRWWSIGGTSDGQSSWWSDTPAAVYPAPIGSVNGRVLESDDTIFVGQNINVAAIEALADDLTTVLLIRSNTRDVTGIEPVSTPLDHYEAYRVAYSETLDLNDGSTPYTVNYVRWERPELGLIAIFASGIQISYDTYDIVINSLNALLQSHTP